MAIVTVVVAGMMVGVEFAVAVFVNPILNRLPDDSCIAARGDGARVLGRVMPVWYISSMVLGAVWAAVAWGGAGVSLVTAATVLPAVSVVRDRARLRPVRGCPQPVTLSAP